MHDAYKFPRQPGVAPYYLRESSLVERLREVSRSEAGTIVRKARVSDMQRSRSDLAATVAEFETTHVVDVPKL